jgi:hypothetical protein
MPITDMMKPITDKVEIIEEGVGQLYQGWQETTTHLAEGITYLAGRIVQQRYFNIFLALWPLILLVLYHFIIIR